jgi:hypothetical protein
MGSKLITIALLLAAAAQPAETRRHPYRSAYVKDTFGKKAAVRTGASAGIQQLRNSPHEWGQGPKGFGKRVGSALGQHIIKNSIQYPIAAIRHEELGYRPSGKKGFGPRMGYALSSTVITHKTTTGKKTVAAGRISGAMGSGFISRAWMPARLHTFSSGAASGGIMLGADAGNNVVREFWPEIRHPRSAKARSSALAKAHGSTSGR